jgi:hypothetical protein
LAPSDSDKDNDNLDGNDSGAETEQECLNEAQLAELAQRFPSNMSEAPPTKLEDDDTV